MKNTLIQVAGWYGLFAVLGAYTLFSFALIQPQSFPYQLLNLSGWLGMGFFAYTKKVYPVAVLAVVWVGLALYSLWVLMVT